MAHVSWRLIKRGRIIIPYGVGKESKQNLLTLEEREKTERGVEWSAVAKQALPATSASRLQMGKTEIGPNTEGII